MCVESEEWRERVIVKHQVIANGMHVLFQQIVLHERRMLRFDSIRSHCSEAYARYNLLSIPNQTSGIHGALLCPAGLQQRNDPDPSLPHLTFYTRIPLTPCHCSSYLLSAAGTASTFRFTALLTLRARV